MNKNGIQMKQDCCYDALRMMPGNPAQVCRVGFLVHSYHLGGLERCIAHLINQLDPSRFQCALICLAQNGAAWDWIEHPERIPVIELQKNPGNDFRIAGRLAKAIRDLDLQIVHSHNWGTLLECSLALRGLRNVRHVHAEHGLELDAFRVRGWKKHIRRFAMQWTMKRADAVVACAHAVKAWICDSCKLSPDKVRLIANGVVPPEKSDAADDRLARRLELGIRGDSFVFGSVGRLVALKDFGQCLEATERLRANGRDVHFLLVGDGPEHDRLLAQASHLRILDRVHMVGRRQNVGDWLQLMDVYVNSSRSEAMNMGILEAMSYGLPVVATDVGDSRLLLGTEMPAGLLTGACDVDAFTRALAEFADDPDARQRHAANALARFQKQYTVEGMCASYARLYEELTEMVDDTFVHCGSLQCD